MLKVPVVAITGPTATGKSEVADLLAHRLSSCVISCDAMQVYRGMDIGTAKLPASERSVPLLMVDIVDPDEAYSAALYQREARHLIDGIRERDHVAVLCGGTGLYVRAALDDMRFPSGDLLDDRRRRYQEMASELGPAGIHAYLASLDPQSAALIHPNNVRRTIRALEMLEDGTSYAQQNTGFSRPAQYYPQLVYALTREREHLYARIDARVDAMMAQGLLDEVRELVASGYADALTSNQAIGYKELISYLAGECSLSDAVELIKRRSRRYAKRQLSWCRRDSRMRWISMDDASPHEAVDRILGDLRLGGMIV